MLPKQEKQFHQYANQALKVALQIAEQKTAACYPGAPPRLEQARREIIVAFNSIVRALIELFKIEPGHTSG